MQADKPWKEVAGFTGKALFQTSGNGFVLKLETGTRRLENCDAWRIWPSPTTGPFGYAGKHYRGGLELRRQGGWLINAVSLEDYLRGVVPYEIGKRDSSAFAALEAQAIVARTYALRRRVSRQGQIYDVHPDVQDQVYGGADGEYPLADSAVRVTRGVLLAYRDKPGNMTAEDLAETYYHSTCGGYTASKHEAWGGKPIPYLKASPDRDAQGMAYCRASSFSQWTRSWDAPVLAKIIRQQQGTANKGSQLSIHRIDGMRVLGHFSCGRISQLDIATDAGTLSLRGDKTRWALRPGDGKGRILESARFRITLEGGKVTATGSGFGHGIGLCQMGALGRAAAGQSAHEILDAYFPGTQWVRLY
jgi:stage II sporulation protein D